MPRFLLLLLAAIPLFAAAGCGAGAGSGSDAGGGGLRVVATIAPVGALARAVAGDNLALTVLVKPGVDPHQYDLSPGDRKALEQANVILRNGIGIDAFLDDTIDPRRAVTVTDGIQARRANVPAGQAVADDPHVWHDPLNAMRMVDNIAAAFAAKDPANAATYRANAERYKQKLQQVDAEVRAIIDTIPPANRKVVTNHDSIGYFLARYNLEYVGAVIPSLSTGAEPSAQDVARLSDLIRSAGVKAIFAESSVNPKVAEQIGRDTGVRVVTGLYADSIGLPGSGADTIDGMLLANARTIAEGLR